jgi:hypothetical protein
MYTIGSNIECNLRVIIDDQQCTILSCGHTQAGGRFMDP